MDMVVLLQKAECMFSDPRAESYNFHLLVVKAAMREWMGTAPEMGVGGGHTILAWNHVMKDADLMIYPLSFSCFFFFFFLIFIYLSVLGFCCNMQAL